MVNSILALFLLFITKSDCYSRIPGKRNIIQARRNTLQKNIEIYESINECNITDLTSCGEMCTRCIGKGVVLCEYCHGTGFLTMGDAIIGTGNNCTVCMGTGEKECKKCMGSGYIAKWRKGSTQ